MEARAFCQGSSSGWFRLCCPLVPLARDWGFPIHSLLGSLNHAHTLTEDRLESPLLKAASASCRDPVDTIIYGVNHTLPTYSIETDLQCSQFSIIVKHYYVELLHTVLYKFMQQFENIYRLLAQEQVLGRSVPHLTRHRVVMLQNSSISWYTNPKFMGVPGYSYWMLMLGITQLSNFASFLGIKGNLITVLACIFLITHESKHLFKCFLVWGFSLSLFVHLSFSSGF